MSEAALAFLIDAPLQSWGVASRFQRRETESWPSKSALLGLLAAALGIDKEDPDEAGKLAPYAELVLTVLRWEKSQPALRLSDYHTIGGGWDKSHPVEKLHVPRKASGGPFGTVVTRRTYLTDARFIALFEGGEDVLRTAASALRNPVWGIWFGRKTCLPASPLAPVVAGTIGEAIELFGERLGMGREDWLRFEGVTERPGEGAWFPQDQPVAFGRHHAPVAEPYRSRPVRRLVSGEWG